MLTFNEILILAFVICLAIGLSLFFTMTRTAVVDCVVTGIDDNPKTHFVVTYVVNGVTYTGNLYIASSGIGATEKIYYQPSNPSNSGSSQATGNTIGIVFMSLAGLIGLILLYANRYILLSKILSKIKNN